MKNIFLIIGIFLIGIFVMIGCKKEDKVGFLSNNIKYPTQTINATVGASLIRSSSMTLDGSTLPVEFSIASIKKADGTEATELMNYHVDTYFWHAAYTGTEIEKVEIEAKRDKVNRPAIDINPANGQIIIYPEATDTTKLVKGKYIIDVKVKNSSEERIITNALTINVTYTAPYYYRLLGVDGKITNLQTKFTRVANEGNQIIIKVVDKDDKAVDPKKLIGYDYGSNGIVDLRNWKNLGLSEPTKYTEYPDRIELEVASFPFPFVAGKVRTIDMYNNGDINGSYFNFWFDFAIYKPGIWTIDIKLLY